MKKSENNLLFCEIVLYLRIRVICKMEEPKGYSGKMKQICVNVENVKLVGRSLLVENVRWVALSGAGAAFRFQGKQLAITIHGSNNATAPDNDTCYARFAILVNGERMVDDIMDTAKKCYQVIDKEEVQEAEVQIIKLSESAMSAIGIAPLTCDEDAVISPIARKLHTIEFIGDSITCGYGTDDMDLSHTFSTQTEDVTKAYAYKTAQLLEADYSLFSCSGYGIISGYTPDPEIRGAVELIPPYYESQCFCRDDFGSAGSPENIPWDFSKYQPQVVVINLGTNDDSFCQDTEWKREEYRQKYVEFLKVVRKNNPVAEIFCVLGLMGDRLYDKVCLAREDYVKQTDDIHIHTIHIPDQSTVGGNVIDYHPTPQAHTMASEVVAAAIKAQMGW